MVTKVLDDLNIVYIQNSCLVFVINCLNIQLHIKLISFP